MVLLCMLTGPSPRIFAWGVHLAVVPLAAHITALMHTSCSQPCAECSASSSTSGFLSGPDMKHHSSASQVSQINLIYKLREDLMLLRATKHQNTFLTLTDDSTPSLISTVLFAVVFPSHFFQLLCGYIW